MKVDINKILESSPKKRVLTLINHQADIGVCNGKGFLSQDEITTIVASFKADKELKIYSKYRELFKKAQNLLTLINQSDLAYKADLQYLDKLIILKTIRDDLNNLQSSAVDTELKNKINELINNSIIARLFKEAHLTNTLNGNLIPGYIEVLKRRQTSLKSAIQAFKDSNKEHSLHVKAFDRVISSIEDEHGKDFNMRFYKAYLVKNADYGSIKVDFEQYKKFKEICL